MESIDNGPRGGYREVEGKQYQFGLISEQDMGDFIFVEPTGGTERRALEDYIRELAKSQGKEVRARFIDEELVAHPE